MAPTITEDAAAAGQGSLDIYYDQHDVAYKPRMPLENSIDDIDLRRVCRLASSCPLYLEGF